MTCKQCKRALSSYIDDELRAEEKVHVQTHLEGCTSCMAHYRNLSEVWEMLEAVPGAAENPYFFIRLTARMKAKAAGQRRRGLERFIIPVSTVVALVLGILVGSIVGANGGRTVAAVSGEEVWADALELETLNDFPETSVGNALFAMADRD